MDYQSPTMKRQRADAKAKDEVAKKAFRVRTGGKAVLVTSADRRRWAERKAERVKDAEEWIAKLRKRRTKETANARTE